MRRIILPFLFAAALVTAAANPRAAPPGAFASAGSSLEFKRECEEPVYAGLRHCVHSHRDIVVHVLIVDLANRYVSFKLVLPADRSAGAESELMECASTRHCGDGFYPFETVPQMLARHSAWGAVAGINTDYFGLSHRPDHGAEGVAVRDGRRLDDAADPGLVGHTSLAISRNNQAGLIWLGPRNTGLDLQDLHYTVAGGGPQIVIDGQPLDNHACQNDRLHVAVCARIFETAAGLNGRHLVLAVARYLDSAGIAAFLANEYGVTSAIKFDGGGSAQMAWLDAMGQVAGFDASDQTDGGFRKVAEGLLVYSIPIARTPAERPR